MIKACFLIFIAALISNPVGASTTVAFIGDTGVDRNARAVLRLVVAEGTDLLVIQGDLGYGRSAAPLWIAGMDQILGDKFPVLLTVGNHENYDWPDYRQWLSQRVSDVPELNCQGSLGVKAHCSFRNLSILHVAAGVFEVDGVSERDDYAGFLEDELSNTPNVWRICSWHKNQERMQIGKKTDSTGWGVYSACLKHGAIIATAHQHAYSRTFLMSDFENQVVAHRNDKLEIGPGKSFTFVSGLGGMEIRDQVLSGDWWASIYSKTQNAYHGALFCTFEDITAECEFKDILGDVQDRFTLENRNRPKR